MASEPEVTDKPAEDHVNLGVAGRLTRTFLDSPLTPMLLVAFLLLGIVGLIATPRQEDPQISVPMVDIFVRYPGNSAEQVANQIATPLEQIMSEIKGVHHVYSASVRDQAIVTVEFHVGEEMEPSLVKLYDKLASHMDRIPPGASEPLVKPKGVDDVPIVTLTLWSNDVDDAALRLVALDLRKHIKAIPDTSQTFIVSGRREQMTIHVYPEKLAGHGVTLDQIAQAIQAANAEARAGESEAGGQVATVYTGAFLKTKEDLERLIVGMNKGRPVYLRDVADVRRGPSEAKALVSYYTGAATEQASDLRANGVPAVTLAVAKKKGTNGVTVAEEVLETVEALKGRVIPDNVHVAVTRNYGETAREKVNELIFKLFVATGAVVILVWFFLAWRAAMVVAIVIPIVILFTVFGALILHYTIDRVSLFALIFSIGILVDDAIVVVENIYRRWLEKSDTSAGITIDAVAEVGNPTILATFTVVAALLPMAAVRGMMGPYMEPIPVLGSVAMVFSLFAAFVFTPWLATRLKPPMHALKKAEEKEHREVELLGRFYRRLLRPMIEDRRRGQIFLVSLFVVFFLCISLFYFKAVRVKMLPLDNKPEFNIVINMPEGTALPDTANVTARVADAIRGIPEITALQTYVGTASPFNFNGLVRHYYLRQNPWEADIQVQLLNKKDRDRTSHEIAEQVRAIVKPIVREAGGRQQIVEMPPGPPVLQSVVAEIYGPDDATRRQVGRDMMEMFEKAPHLDDVDTLMPDPYQVWRFVVDREKVQKLGLTVADVNRTLEMAMGGYKLGDIKYQSVLDVTPIVLEVPLSVRSDFGRIGQLPVGTRDGRIVPLSELGRWVREWQDLTIFHKDLRPLEFVTAETVGDLAAPIYGMLEVMDQLEDYTPPDGGELEMSWYGPPENQFHSGFEWGGEWTVTYETFRDMGIAFMVALVLIYMLVVWEFGNFVLPAIIMAPIPLTLVGIIPGHWLLDAEFTATSMIGFIALAGIIVRNSILLVDFTGHRIREGVPVLDALIAACQVRTRPIVITALALVGGSSVILFDPIFQGMAVSLLFGVLVSTALTLFIIPLGCYSARYHFEGVPAEALAEAETAAGGGFGAKLAGFLHIVGIYLGLLLKGLFSLLKGLIGMLWARVRSRGGPGGGGGGTPTPAPAGPAPAPAGGASAAQVDTPAPQARSAAPAAPADTAPAPASGEAAAKAADAPATAAGTATADEAAPKKKAPARKATTKKATAKKKAASKKKATTKKSTAKKATAKKKAATSKKAAPATPAAEPTAPAEEPAGNVAPAAQAEAADDKPAGSVPPAPKKVASRPKGKGRRGIRLKGAGGAGESDVSKSGK